MVRMSDLVRGLGRDAAAGRAGRAAAGAAPERARPAAAAHRAPRWRSRGPLPRAPGRAPAPPTTRRRCSGELQELLLEVRGLARGTGELSVAAPAGADRPRRHLAGALARPVLGRQQPGRGPRRGLPGLPPGAGGRDGAAHRRQRRLRPPPAASRSGMAGCLIDVGLWQMPETLLRRLDTPGRRGAGRLPLAPAAVGRPRAPMGAARRGDRPGRPRAPRARAGPGLPAGADRHRRRRRRQDPRPGRHLHRAHGAADRAAAAAPARGGAGDRQVAARGVPVRRSSRRCCRRSRSSPRHRGAAQHRGDRSRHRGQPQPSAPAPRVEIMADSKGQRLPTPKIVDLSEAPFLYVTGPVTEASR